MSLYENIGREWSANSRTGSRRQCPTAHYASISTGVPVIGLSGVPVDMVVGDSGKGEGYITPDFFVTNNAGKLEITLNSRNAPDLRISEGYRDMLKDYDRGTKKDKRQKEAVLFIKQTHGSAKSLLPHLLLSLQKRK